MKIAFLTMVMFGEAALSPLFADNLLEEVVASDAAADAVVAAIRTPEDTHEECFEDSAT